MVRDIRLPEAVTRDYLIHHRVCPKAFAEDGSLIVLAAPDALDDAFSDLSFVYQCSVRTEPASAEDVQRQIERLVGQSSRTVELSAVPAGQDSFATDVRDLVNQPPVVRYVNLLVAEAYDSEASDIHLEATRSGLSVRFRVDGVLLAAPEPPAGLEPAVVSRVKLLADLDVAERRRPQDGRIRVRLESRELDVRVSTVPTMFGESLAMRLLDHGGRPVELDELGMDPGVLEAFSRLAERRHGMILVTGPTGSGKTTTLYAGLRRRDAAAEKIVTVEDPIEYHLPGVTQVPVRREGGVTFGSALRSILRQDPDVLMVGEMRDEETAEVAVQAAMTGHLVFSTLHTNDAVSVVPRLLDLHVRDYLIAATVEGMLAQRLVRRVCDGCRTAYEPASENVARLSGRPAGQLRLERGAGCGACRGTGFRGRIGLFELCVMTDDLRDGILRNAPRALLRDLAQEAGMVPLRADGWAKVQSGLTTVEEVLRVVQE